MRKSVPLLIAIAMAAIVLTPLVLDTVDSESTNHTMAMEQAFDSPSSSDTSILSSYYDDKYEWMDEYTYDDPRIFVVFAILSMIVLVMLFREVKKHGIYSETIKKESGREYCPQCGCERSSEYEFCPICGYRPTKH